MKSVRLLWERNRSNSHIPLSRLQKAVIGLYLVLRDWRRGAFPRKFERETTWRNECQYAMAMSGLTAEQVIELGNAKPFDLRTDEFEIHYRNFSRIRAILRELDVRPPARVLELGCGQGWLSEMLALTGFHVSGTTIAQYEVDEAQRRADAFRLRNIPGSLDFFASPMERIDTQVSAQDCILVYEALHHAFDWRETIHSVARALKPGGWFLICAEPNIAHTVVSYRVGLLTNTHEIGISRRQLKNELRASGFSRIITYSTPFHFWLGWHWIAAQL